MKKFMIILGGILLLATGGVLAWHKMYPTYVYRYKMTVEIDTPSGMKSGSNVYEVRTWEAPRWLRVLSGSSTEIEGEPMLIDIDEKKKILVLMIHGLWPKNNMMNVLFPYAFFKPRCDSPNYLEWAKEISQMKEIEVELPPVLVSNMALFQDYTDPSSITMLYEAGYDGFCRDNKPIIGDNFSLVLGEGYSLRKVTVSLTNELVERKIHKILPWWSDEKTQQELWQYLSKNRTRDYDKN